MLDRIIGIDPGSEESGMCVLDDFTIIGAFNLKNDYQLFDKVTNYSIHGNLTVAIEDIKPYSSQLMQTVIDTCKFIGEVSFRLKSVGINVQLISRYEVKRWVFDTFPEVCLPIINSKNNKKVFDCCDIITRELFQKDNNGRGVRKASFHSVDDKVVTESMKHLYKIPLPKSGKGYRYGLQTHSWQALAVALCYSHLRRK